MSRRWILFFFGDCLAGALTGMAVTLVVRLLVTPGFDMVAAMMLGTAAGTLVHIVLGIVFSPALGMFETMVPGMFIGMHGGMLFGMRDSMQHIGLPVALGVGAIFGVVVVIVVTFWDAQLRRQTRASGPPRDGPRELTPKAVTEARHEPA